MNEDYEIELYEKLTMPYVVFSQNAFVQKRILAWHITKLSGDELLFATPQSFYFEGVVAGLTFEHLEYIARKAPMSYKTELISAMSDMQFMDRVFEIAESMDDDLGGNTTRNRDRIASIIKYIEYNKIAFQI